MATFAQEIYLKRSEKLHPVHPLGFTSHQRIEINYSPSSLEWENIFKIFTFDGQIAFAEYLSKVYDYFSQKEILIY